ncbi:MAG: hypothetical protein M3297_13645 [Thermoproteota archaeon]|nr:hypothetical protein [Thermoproteota archaeon]
MKPSHMFSRPMLIYDDKCSSCTEFAKTVNILSRGWVNTAGHYYSNRALEAKRIVFPPGYDATKMFWLINRNGAYGARKALWPLIKEIITGLFRGKQQNQAKAGSKSSTIDPEFCGYTGQNISCESAGNTLKRIASMMRNSGVFQFKD